MARGSRKVDDRFFFKKRNILIRNFECSSQHKIENRGWFAIFRVLLDQKTRRSRAISSSVSFQALPWTTTRKIYDLLNPIGASNLDESEFLARLSPYGRWERFTARGSRGMKSRRPESILRRAERLRGDHIGPVIIGSVMTTLDIWRCALLRVPTNKTSGDICVQTPLMNETHSGRGWKSRFWTNLQTHNLQGGLCHTNGKDSAASQCSQELFSCPWSDIWWKNNCASCPAGMENPLPGFPGKSLLGSVSTVWIIHGPRVVPCGTPEWSCRPRSHEKQNTIVVDPESSAKSTNFSWKIRHLCTNWLEDLKAPSVLPKWSNPVSWTVCSWILRSTPAVFLPQRHCGLAQAVGWLVYDSIESKVDRTRQLRSELQN